MLPVKFWRHWEAPLYRCYYYYLPWPSPTRKRRFILLIHRYFPWLTRQTASYRMLPYARHEDLRGINIDAAKRQAHDYSNWRAAYVLLSTRTCRRLQRNISYFKSRPRLGVWVIPGREKDEAITRQSLQQQWYQPVQIHMLTPDADLVDLPVDYLVVVPAGVQLHKTALLYVAQAIHERPKGQLFYADEEWLNDSGRLLGPWFKPEWDHHLMLALNLIGAFAVYHRNQLAGHSYRVDDPVWDYDLALQISERLQTRQIVHIPRVLASCKAESLPEQSLLRILTQSLKRQTQATVIEPSPLVTGSLRVRYELPEPAPLVSLIIPTRNQYALLRCCLDTLISKTLYPTYEILVVDNGSDEADAVTFLASLQPRYAPIPIRVIRDNSPFNFSHLNNRGVEQASGALIGLLNNDLEVIEGHWLHEMASQACRPGIGAVGARMLYPNGRLQHAGVVVGLGGAAGHVLRSSFADQPDCFGPPGLGRSRFVQHFSAVTAACLVVRKNLYQQVHGLDEKAFPIAYNDVDFCLKLQDYGYRNLYTPFATLYHHESASRGSNDDDPAKAAQAAQELANLQKRWSTWDYHDPAYNPNFSLYGEDCSYSYPPRV